MRLKGFVISHSAEIEARHSADREIGPGVTLVCARKSKIPLKDLLAPQQCEPKFSSSS